MVRDRHPDGDQQGTERGTERGRESDPASPPLDSDEQRADPPGSDPSLLEPGSVQEADGGTANGWAEAIARGEHDIGLDPDHGADWTALVAPDLLDDRDSGSDGL